MSADEYTAALAGLQQQAHDLYMAIANVMSSLPQSAAGQLTPQWDELYAVSRLAHVAGDLLTAAHGRARDERDADQPVPFTLADD